MKTSRKALAIVLSVAMVLSAMVFSISAADFDETWTAVTNAAELKAVENNLAGKYYLANDITLTGSFESIGWLESGDAAFTGTFDGNGKTISGLEIESGSNAGLFAINAGVIENLTVADANVTVSKQGGVIAGVNEKDGVISNCTVSDSIVSGSFSASAKYKYWLSDGYQVGGVVGLNEGTVEKCLNKDTDVRGWLEVGGIVGHNSGTVSQCASSGDINSTNSGVASNAQINRFRWAAQSAYLAGGECAYGRAGGVVGYNEGTVSDVFVASSKSNTFVNIAGWNSVGGVCGKNEGTIKNAYSSSTKFTMPNHGAEFVFPSYTSYSGTYTWSSDVYFHPLVGSQQNGKTENSFFSEVVSGSMPGQSFKDGGRGNSVSDSEMQNEEMFKEAGWDYDNIWTTDEASGFPILKFLACEHDWVETKRTEPTCGAEGSVTYVCSKCGATKTEIIPATGEHVWNDGVVTKEPTCTVDGEKTYTCTVCGATKTEAIPATGKHEDKDGDGKCDGCGKDMQDVCDHKNTEVVGAKEPTCGDEGYTGDTVCSDCGKVLEKGEVIPATGEHVWDEGVVTTEPTCGKDGEKTYTCNVCGATKTETIPATGHDYEVVGKKDATCTEDGYTGDEVCSKCGDVKSTGSVIPAKGHNDKNGDGKCDDCGADLGGTSHDGDSTSGSQRFFDSLLNWFTRLMILVRHLLGMTA